MLLALALAACGGGGDDGDPQAQTPAQPAPRVMTLADVTVADSQTPAGASTSEYSVGLSGPQFVVPAGATSVEACADARMVVYTATASRVALETTLGGVSGGAAAPAMTMDLPGPAGAALTVKRCAPVTNAAALAIFMRATATSATMYRYEATVRWTVQAVVP